MALQPVAHESPLSFDISFLKGTLLAGGTTYLLWQILAPESWVEKIGLLAFDLIALLALYKCSCKRPEREKNELEKWEDLFQTFTSSDQFSELGQSGLDYTDFWNRSFESGERSWDTGDAQRKPLHAASVKVIKFIASSYIPKGSKILELGSNILDHQGLSYLARLLPSDHLPNLSYSDYLRPVVDRESLKTTRSYRHLDIRNPAQDLFESQNCIVAINVADVLSRRDLVQMARGCNQLLKSGGCALIMADRLIDPIPLFAKFSQSEDFIFPWVEATTNGSGQVRHLKGAKKATVAKLRGLIQSLDNEYRTFFEKLFKLTPPQRHYYLWKSFFAGHFLSTFLNMILLNERCDCYPTFESYENDVITAFQSQKFTVQLRGISKASHTVVHPDPDYQNSSGIPYNSLTLELKEGKFQTSKVSGIPTGKLKTTASFHTLIFKKK